MKRVLALGVTCFAVLGCGGFKADCPSGGGTMAATFSNIIGANTKGDPFTGVFITGLISGTTTSIEADAEDNENCAGQRNIHLCIGEKPRAGASYQVDDHCDAPSGTAPATASVTFYDNRPFGTSTDLRDWQGASGTITVGEASATKLTYTVEASMDWLLAKVIPDADDSRGTFTLSIQGSVDPFPTPKP